jgi:glutamate 5-kinase
MKKKIIIKIGTSTLTANTDRISYAKIEDIARQIVILKNDFEIILVTSGAIATARQFMEINGENQSLASKQAMAAIGQPKLMRLYDEIFNSFELKIAQCLLTYADFKNDEARTNTENTIISLLAHGYVPIINENDTVAVEEIVLGDNDKLSALVASILPADFLIIASDVDGLYDKNPHLHPEAKLIDEVTDLRQVALFAEEKVSGPGTGGMASKIQAAEICKQYGIEMWIVNGGKNNFIVDALQDISAFTKFRF